MRQKLMLAGLVSLALIITGLLVPVVGAQEKGEADIASAVATYHVQANEIVNDKLRLLAAAMEELAEDPAARGKRIRARFESPATKEDCEEENLSVFCLDEALQVEHEKMVVKLNKLATGIGTDGNASKRRKIIKAQRQQADDVRAQVSDAYAQIIIANVMHYENQLTIAEVENLNDHLEDLVDEVETLPFEFVNVSTASCR